MFHPLSVISFKTIFEFYCPCLVQSIVFITPYMLMGHSQYYVVEDHLFLGLPSWEVLPHYPVLWQAPLPSRVPVL
jgi:hypothetical protein